MLKNHIRITIRSISKNAIYSLTNISGLAIGLTCNLLMALWVLDETSYNKFIPKKNRLYQVYTSGKFEGKIDTWESVPLPTYQAMKTADNHIVSSVVTDWGYEHLLATDDIKIYKKGYYVSEEFLEMFEFPMVSGLRYRQRNLCQIRRANRYQGQCSQG
ncbi:MAG: ABC transporter permease [Bacteroidota bacterium]